MKSPFKFLDSYTREDREIFFGRDREIEEMYQKVFESKILLVYGISGTGKTSLIDCGLANKFEESDWLPVTVRRGTNITDSFVKELGKAAISPVKIDSGQGSILKAIQSIYLDHFKPIYLIFDQFEELFIFGDREEREEFIGIIKTIVESDVQCRFIFSIREEYLASVTEFELTINDFLSNRMRIEKMTRQHAVEVIEGPCRVHGIEVEEKFADALLEKLNPQGKEVELTYLQVFLDKIYKLALQQSPESKTKNQKPGTRNQEHRAEGIGHRMEFSIRLLDEAGDVSDLLGSFLEEQVSELDDPDTGLIVLKAFVSMQGTKKQIGQEEISDFARTLGKPVEEKTLTELLQKFVNLRVLRDKDENDRYELRHDSLATKIYEKITLVERELLEIKDFLDNAFMNYERRGVFLSEADLKYIAPFEDKLFLSKRLDKFIEESKSITERIRRRKRRTTAVILAAVLLIFTGITIWALIERKNAFLSAEEAAKAKQEKEQIEKLLSIGASGTPTVVISPLKMNILYIGVDNPVSIAVPGFTYENLSARISNGRIWKDDKEVYHVSPTKEGICEISVFATIEGVTYKLGSSSFRVKSVANPVIKVGQYTGGDITKESLLDAGRVDAVLDVSFEFDFTYSVIQFKLGTYVNGVYVETSSSSNRFTEEQINLFQRVIEEGLIFIYDVKAVGPDGSVRSINGTIFKISDNN